MKRSIFWELNGEPDINDTVEEIELTEEIQRQVAELHNATESIIDTEFAEDGHIVDTTVETFPDEQLVRVRLNQSLHDGSQPVNFSAMVDYTGKLKSVLLNRSTDQTLIDWESPVKAAIFYRECEPQNISTLSTKAPEIVVPQGLLYPLTPISEGVRNYEEYLKTPGIPLSAVCALEWLTSSSSLKLQVASDPVLNRMVRTTEMARRSTSQDLDILKAQLLRHKQLIKSSRVGKKMLTNDQKAVVPDGEYVMTEMTIDLDENGQTKACLNMGSVITHAGSRKFWTRSHAYLLGNLEIAANGYELWRLSRDDTNPNAKNKAELEVLPISHRSIGTNRSLEVGNIDQPVSIANLLLSIVKGKLLEV